MLTIKTEQSEARAYVAVPAGGSGPGVLVLHAWWGLTPFFMGLCDRLAEAGFVALAPDMFKGQTASTPDQARALVEKAEGDKASQDEVVGVITAALDALRAHPAVRGPRVGVVGLSFGATWGIVLSNQRPEEVAAVVLFYGIYPADFTPSRAAYLGHFAEHDDYESMDNVRESEQAMRAAGREVTIHVYPGTSHWFFEDNVTSAYQPEAAQLAWDRTVEFLRRCL